MPTPSDTRSASRTILSSRIVTIGILAILAAILLGPTFSAPAFDWMRHSTSEQAGQNMPGAWIMRAGFLAYGASIMTAVALQPRKSGWVRLALSVFGAGLVATAIWSNAPIVPGLAADFREDWLHSVASGVVGMAFAAACAARLFAPGGSRSDLLAWLGLVISVAIPLAMEALPELRGLLQRTMFGFSFVFVLREFVTR